MTYLEGIERECVRLGLPASVAQKLWEYLLPFWLDHFTGRVPICDARMIMAAL